MHHTTVALKLQHFQYNLKKFFFGAFSAQYFLCFLGQVTVAKGWGGKPLLLSMALLHVGAGCRARGQQCLPHPLSALPFLCGAPEGLQWGGGGGQGTCACVGAMAQGAAELVPEVDGSLQ